MTMPDPYARFRPNADGQFNYSFDDPNTQIDLDSMRNTLQIFEQRGLDTTDIKKQIAELSTQLRQQNDANPRNAMGTGDS